MRLGFEVKNAGLAHPTHFTVLAGAVANGNRGVWHVRDREQQRAPLLLEGLQRDVALLHLLPAGAVGVNQGADVFAGLLATGDLFGCGVLLALECLDLEDQRAASLVKGRQRAENRLRVGAAVLQGSADEVGVVAKESWVEHSDWILY